MIVKKHEIPITMLQLAALKRRLDLTHPQYSTIVDDHVIHQSGYYGELGFDYYLRAIDDDVCILQSLRVVGPNAFQIDNLILTPNFILIVEVKNFTGNIEFDHEFGQMTQHSNGRTRSFKDPINQVDTQIFHLKNWLMQHGYSAIPIEALVVFVSNHVHLTRNGGHEVDKRLIRAGKFIERYQGLKQKYKTSMLSRQQIVNLSNMLMHRHTPLHVDVLKRYNIALRDLLTGTHCPMCSNLPMERIYGRWICTSCKYISRDAHVNSLKDFKLLIKNYITNREARWMLQIDDIKLVTRLLKSGKFSSTGYKKDRVYKLDYDFQKDYIHLLKK